MNTIHIAETVSPEPRDREKSHRLRRIAEEMNGEEVTLDFAGVTWTGRSFMDEFVEDFIANPPCKVSIVNMDELSRKMLETVKRTHSNPSGSFILSSPDPEITPFTF